MKWNCIVGFSIMLVAVFSFFCADLGPVPASQKQEESNEPEGLCLTDCLAGEALLPEGIELSEDGEIPKNKARIERITVLNEDKQPEFVDVPKPQRFVALVSVDKAWEDGQTLVIQFLNRHDDSSLVKQVQHHAREWEKVANLRFRFLPPGDTPQQHKFKRAHIKIRFEGTGGGGWSYVGTDSLKAAAKEEEHSMELHINSSTSPKDIQKVVLHEFGHALGFHHEHQNPKGGIKWKQPAAFNYYKQATKKTGREWSDDEIRLNIFERIEGADVKATRFDKFSIMLYPVPKGLTTDGFWHGWNTQLSNTDKYIASWLYPPIWVPSLKIVAKTSPGFMPPGVILCRNAPNNSPLAKLRGPKVQARLEVGDIITKINDKSVGTKRRFEDALLEIKDDFDITVRDIKTGELRGYSGKLPRSP